MKLKGLLIDIHKRKIFPAIITIKNGKIGNIELNKGNEGNFILPGLIDSHIHIESSMVSPGSFAMEAVSRGTIGVVSDPHEIANVLGTDGVNIMIEDGEKVPLKFWFVPVLFSPQYLSKLQLNQRMVLPFSFQPSSPRAIHPIA